MLLDGPPLDPTAEQARAWLRDELAQGAYADRPGLVQRFLDWVAELLGRGGIGSVGDTSWTRPLAVLGLLAVLALVGLAVAKGMRPERRVRRRGGARGVLAGEDRSADALRRDADAALAGGDWDRAVVSAVRALTRGAMDRTLLADSPGLTAHEVAGALAPVFPGQATRVGAASDAFDAVFYGHVTTTEQTAREVVATEAALRATRPVLPAVGGPS